MSDERTEVTITDIDIKFESIVWLMVKFAVATIPAAIVLGVTGFFAALVLAAIFK